MRFDFISPASAREASSFSAYAVYSILANGIAHNKNARSASALRARAQTDICRAAATLLGPDIFRRTLSNFFDGRLLREGPAAVGYAHGFRDCLMMGTYC